MSRTSISRFMLAGLLTAAAPVFADSVYTQITNFNTNGDVQSQLVSEVPTGSFTTSNSYATPFTIGTGNNYGVAGPSSSITATVDISNVSNVFTIINAFGPQPGGTVGTLTFNYADGTSSSINLVGGVNVRDYYQGQYANTITDPTVENVFTYSGIVGGAGTGNSSNGDYGTYVFDEQDFALTDTSELVSVVLSSPYSNTSGDCCSGNGSPILVAMTVESAAPVVGTAPEPGSLLLLGVGMAGLGFAGRRLRRS